MRNADVYYENIRYSFEGLQNAVEAMAPIVDMLLLEFDEDEDGAKESLDTLIDYAEGMMTDIRSLLENVDDALDQLTDPCTADDYEDIEDYDEVEESYRTDMVALRS